jgi:hypothetical protein
MLGGLVTASSAQTAVAAASSPARIDASGALNSAKAATTAAAVKGLLNAKTLRFAFSSAAGTCPPGTSDASYCVGGTGELTFTIVITPHGKHHVQAASVEAKIKAGATVRVTAKINRAGLAALKLAKKDKSYVTVALSDEAILSRSSYETAQGTVKIH